MTSKPTTWTLVKPSKPIHKSDMTVPLQLVLVITAKTTKLQEK